jgi:hypothetical protein
MGKKLEDAILQAKFRELLKKYLQSYCSPDFVSDGVVERYMNHHENGYPVPFILFVIKEMM